MLSLLMSHCYNRVPNRINYMPPVAENEKIYGGLSLLKSDYYPMIPSKLLLSYPKLLTRLPSKQSSKAPYSYLPPKK